MNGADEVTPFWIPMPEVLLTVRVICITLEEKKVSLPPL